MANTDRCPRCGALVLPEERFCAQCGAPLEGGAPAADGRMGEAPAAEYTGGVPKTIAELQRFCELNHMPLERMRFFVGTNYRQPRAFGIYRDGDNFVVYKNKADGSRAVRYHGPDEAWAVKELYEKLLDECHKRDIWPGGKPKEVVAAQRKKKRKAVTLVVVIIVLVLAIMAFTIATEVRTHRYDGYYRFDDRSTYYRYGDGWYYYNDYDWVLIDDYPYYEDYSDYYVGDDYDRSWGGYDFKSSDTWEDLHESSHTNSSDYDSWDSGGTDWSSDW